MWEQTREQVAETFFKDRIKLYVNEIVENDIGETLEEPTLVDEYDCNIQNIPSTASSAVGGRSNIQAIRISLQKNLPLNSGSTYKVKIVQARISFTDEMWEVNGWQEGQLSTIINASRGTIV